MNGDLPVAIGLVVMSESTTVRKPPQALSSLPKSAPAPRCVTSGTTVPFGLTSESASAESSCALIRNETRTNDTGPRLRPSATRSRCAPIAELMLPVEYSFVDGAAGRGAEREHRQREQRQALHGPVSETSSSGSVIASIACRAASSSVSGTSTFCGTSSVSRGWCSTAVSSSELDPGRLEDRLDLLGLGDVLGERDLNHVRHRAVSSWSGTGSRLGCGWSAPPLMSCGPPRSWKRDLDHVEVPRNDRLGEDRARLARRLGPEVPRREVRERQHARRSASRASSAASSAVECSVSRARSRSSSQERRLVDEQVGAARGLEHRLGTARCRRRSRPSGRVAASPSTCSGVTTRPSGERHRLAALERAALGPVRDAERVGGLDVEPARPVVLDERVADRRDAVRDREGDEAVVAAVERVARGELDELVRVGEPAEDPAQRAEQLARARAARRS